MRIRARIQVCLYRFRLVCNSGGDGVQLALSSLGDLAASVAALLDETSGFEALKSRSHNVGGATGKSVRLGSSSLVSAEFDAKVSNADTLVQVDLTGDRSCREVKVNNCD